MAKYLQWGTVYQIDEDFVYYDKLNELKFRVCIDGNPEVADFKTAKEAKDFLKWYKKIVPIIKENVLLRSILKQECGVND